VHGLAHSGSGMSLETMWAQFYFPFMCKYVRDQVRKCPVCQLARVQQHTKSKRQLLDEPVEPCDIVDIDHVGPITSTNGTPGYLLTMINCYSYYMVAVEVPNTSVDAACIAFFDRWILDKGTL